MTTPNEEQVVQPTETTQPQGEVNPPTEVSPSAEEAEFAANIYAALDDTSDDEPTGEGDQAIAPSPAETAQPVGSPPVQVATQPVAPVVQTPVPQQVTPAPTPAPAQGQQPVAPPAQAPQAPAAAATPPVSVERPEDGLRVLQQQIESNREQIIDLVAQKTYKLSNEEVDAINVDPAQAIPKIAARIHVNAVQGVLEHVAQQLPNVVAGLLEARTRYDQLENTFYSKWPQLDRGQHGETVKQFAAAYRKVNPEAGFDDMVRIVGAQAVVALGLNPQQVQAQAPAAPQVQRQAPFSPAGVSAPTGGAPKPQAGNLFALYDQILEAENNGAFDN